MSNNILERNFETECEFKTSRSSGKGGQNVNKLETRVELWFNVLQSNLLSTDEKQLILRQLASKLTNGTIIHLQEQSARTQLENKRKIIKKLHQLLVKSLKKEKPRKISKPTKASKEKRLKTKKIDAEKKASRRKFF